jgi:hypothetical protein
MAKSKAVPPCRKCGRKRAGANLLIKGTARRCRHCHNESCRIAMQRLRDSLKPPPKSKEALQLERLQAALKAVGEGTKFIRARRPIVDWITGRVARAHELSQRLAAEAR